MNKNNNKNRQPPPGMAKTQQYATEEIKTQGNNVGQSRAANITHSGTSGVKDGHLNVPHNNNGADADSSG